MLIDTIQGVITCCVFFYLDGTNVTGLEFIWPSMSNFGIGENNKVVLRCKVRSDAEPHFEVCLFIFCKPLFDRMQRTFIF